MKPNPLSSCWCLALWLLGGYAVAQNPGTANQATPSSAAADSLRQRGTDLFAPDAPLSFTLAARMQAVVDDRTMPRADSLATRHAALLTYPPDSLNGGGTLPLALVVRGNFRRSALHCAFPPLYVDFPKKRVKDTPFARQNKLKLVTHCQDEEYIVREYLVYKLYNLLTAVSFRNRLARVTYVDSAKTRPDETRWAFLIEDEDDVANRNGLLEIKGSTPQEAADSVSMTTMAVFEFMIGNIDWAVAEHHNVRLLQRPASTDRPRVVPYDFDHAVIVDAAYASRADKTGQHIYRGLLVPGGLLRRVFDQFNALRPQFYALYETDKRLNQAYVKQTIKYLDVFYGIINTPKSVKKYFFNGDSGGKLFASFR